VRLNQIADLNVVNSPEMITREDARRRMVVQTDVRGTDLGSFVAAAQARVAAAVNLPFGYSIVWGGQFENQQRADRRLAIVLPVSIVVIAALLFATFENVGQTCLILLIVPFALVGGIGALWLRGINLNLSASIGFIALFGVAVLNGVVMVSHICLRLASGTTEHNRVNLARHQVSVAELAQQLPVLHDDLAAQDCRGRPSLNRPALPRAVIANVEIVARERLFDRRIDQHNIRITAGSDDTLARI
jgi:Cu/Ag efflux pump CusA